MYNNLYYYYRPHAIQLLQYLVHNYSSRMDIAFYTSMSTKNANAGVDYLSNKIDDFKLSTSTTTIVKQRQLYLYDQSMNKNDPLGEHSWSFMRDLPKIWNCKNSPGYGHNETTTLMIDDTITKMREYPDNVIVVPEFTEQGVVKGTDTVLIALQHVLDNVFASVAAQSNTDVASFDIRSIIKNSRHSIEKLFMSKP
jgi:hypothetical protein